MSHPHSMYVLVSDKSLLRLDSVPNRTILSSWSLLARTRSCPPNVFAQSPVRLTSVQLLGIYRTGGKRSLLALYRLDFIHCMFGSWIVIPSLLV